MPTAVGPNTFGEENLVFGYDTGDTNNSYRGEPTVNLLYSAGAYNLINGATDIYANVTRTDLGNGKYRFVNDGTGGTTVRVYANEADLIDGETYAVSVYYEDLIGTVSIDWCDQTVTGNNSSTALSGRLTGTSSRSSYTDPFYFLDINLTTGGSVTLYNPQVEHKSHVTPFVAGTRSATQGLIDLTGNSTIDLTNVSFDSSAQITFDGTDEYVSVAYNTALNTPNGATYEIMLYPESGGEFLSRGKSDSGTDPDNPRFYVDGTGYLYFDWTTTGADTYVVTPGSTATFNQWQHVVGVAQPGDQLRIYVNGVEASYNSVVRTVPSPVPNTEDPLIIGGVSWIPRYFGGKIGMVKIYNRVLTASEIRANYNATKGRFNI